MPQNRAERPSDLRKFFGNILENSSNTHHQQNGGRLAFDEFEIDVANGMLLRSGQEVRLTAKVFDLLITLVENSWGGYSLRLNCLKDCGTRSLFRKEISLAVSTLRRARLLANGS